MELINGILKVIGGVSVLGAGLVYLSRLMAQQVFKKNMADYQGKITTELEKLKLQQQKNFKDFELFTLKKHEKYPEMYFHLETAFGEILDLQGTVKSLRYDNFTENELKLHFDNLGMTKFVQDRLLKGWKIDKQSAIVEIRKMERLLDYQRAEDKLREANNYFYYNLLYFSDVVSEKCKDLLASLHEYLIYIDPDLHPPSPEMLKERQKLRQTILPENRDSVRIEMQSELRKE